MTSKQTVLLLSAFAFALTAVGLAGPAAQAFTVGTQSSSSGGAQFADPDEQVANFGGANGTAQQLPSGPNYQAADGYRPGQKRDLSGPIFRSLKSPPMIGDGGYR